MAGERILLVEDAAEVRRFLAETVLTLAGYDVLTAANGEDGLVLARDLRPDLIISDFLMPQRTGLDMLAALQQEKLHFPFILITAEGSEELAVQALRLGVSDYLIKPFDPDDLLAAIQRVLREHWTRQIAERVPAQLLEANRQLEQRLHELDTLVAIGQQVNSQLDLPTVMTDVVRAAVALAHAEDGSLLLLDDATGELYLYATGHTGGGNDSFRLLVTDSLAGQVVRTGQPCVISGSDPFKIKTSHLARDLIYVPLIVQETVIGALGVSNVTASHPFEPQTLRLLSILAGFAAIAIHNAGLYEATRQERDTLNTILRSTDDAILVVDGLGNLSFYNAAASRAFGFDPAASQGTPLYQTVPHHELLDLFGRDGQSRSGEINLDGGKRVLNAQLTQVQGVGKVAVLHDISHLKELDRVKSEFVASVSHDLRSPLTAILGYVELLNRVGPLNDAQRQFVKRIVFSVQSITTLIADLLELGRIEAGFDQSREPIRLHAIAQQGIESLRHQWETKRHLLDAVLPEDLPPTLGNPQRLQQAFNNLLENAIKYTPEGGHIRVRLEADSSFLILHVADTGIGIAAEDQPYIFDKFYRSAEAIEEYSGTGLGLSIVKGIVEQHQGRIWVESQPGRGSVFTVMLPSLNGKH